MKYTERIQHLTEAHNMLNREIDSYERNGNFDETELATMKKQRLRMKDEIEKLKTFTNSLDAI
jgi:hypothetical protein